MRLAFPGIPTNPSGQTRRLTYTLGYGPNFSQRADTSSCCARAGAKFYLCYGTSPAHGSAYRSPRCSWTQAALSYHIHTGPCGRSTSSSNQVLHASLRLPYPSQLLLIPGSALRTRNACRMLPAVKLDCKGCLHPQSVLHIFGKRQTHHSLPLTATPARRLLCTGMPLPPAPRLPTLSP